MTTGRDGELGRAHLERVAFGPVATDADRAVAIAALRELDAEGPSAAEPTALVEPAETETETEPPAIDGAREKVDSGGVNGAARWRQRVPALVVGAVVIVGVVAAVASQSGPGTPAALGSRTVTSPSPDPTANPAAAFKLLLLNQTFADTTYPMHDYASAVGIQPASIHVALESASGDTLWVARSESDICMMWSSPPKDGITEGGAKCVTPRAFANDGGLRLTHNGAVWAWDGVNFTVGTG